MEKDLLDEVLEAVYRNRLNRLPKRKIVKAERKVLTVAATLECGHIVNTTSRSAASGWEYCVECITV